MSIALFEGEARVPIMVHPITGKDPYKALWIGISQVDGETFHLIVETSGQVRWIEESMNGLVTETRYDPAVEDWVEPDR